MVRKVRKKERTGCLVHDLLSNGEERWVPVLVGALCVDLVERDAQREALPWERHIVFVTNVNLNKVEISKR